MSIVLTDAKSGNTSPMAFNTIAVLGASGQNGQAIVTALLKCESHKFNVRAVIPPDSPEPPVPHSDNLKFLKIDLLNASKEFLAIQLKGVDAIVSALNGKVLEAEPKVQDAAAEAGVGRFYPSEYGFHQVYHKPGSDWGYIHPLWDFKSRIVNKALHHPAIADKRMSYTLIGCGDFYNQDREPVWCPWTQREPEGGEYVLHVIGSADEQADYTHMDDFARFVVATLLEPEKSRDAHLNFVSDTISQTEIARLLEKYSSKKVRIEQYSDDDKHRIVENPESAADELKQSAFPVDFWFLVKGE